MDKAIIPLVFLIMLLLAPVMGESFQAVGQPRELTGLPVPFNEWGIDAANGYIGIISADPGGRIFHLFDDSGKEIFNVFSPEDEPFCVVKMNGYQNVVILGQYLFEAEYDFTVYDYSGNKLFGPLTESSQLLTSPHGSFYYTINDVIVGGARPAIYDAQGRLLAELKPKGDFWELTALSDTTILFHNETDAEVISIPELAVIKTISAPNYKPNPGDINTGASPDGTHYAVIAIGGIFIFDIVSGTYVTVPLSDSLSSPEVALSDSGTYLVATDNIPHRRRHKLTEYIKDGAGYRPIVIDAEIPFIGDVEASRGQPYFVGNVCMMTFISRDSLGKRLQTFVHAISSDSRDLNSGMAVDGLAVSYVKDTIAGIQLYSVDRKAKTAQAQLIRAMEANREEK